MTVNTPKNAFAAGSLPESQNSEGELARLPRTLAGFEGTASLQREIEQKEEIKKGRRKMGRKKMRERGENTPSEINS